MRRLAVVAVALLALTGCGPTEGEVVDKKHIPNRSYWGNVPVETCSGTGSARRCTTRWENRYHSRPEEWHLYLNFQGKVHDKRVNRTTYYRWNIGDYYQEK